MNTADIRTALVNGYIAGSFGIDTFYENNTSQPDGNEHVLFDFVAAANDGVALGATGKDETTGFLQLTLRYPLDTGSGTLLSKTDAIVNYFRNGRSFTHNSHAVTIKRSTFTTPAPDGGWFASTMTIYWYARSNRS